MSEEDDLKKKADLLSEMYDQGERRGDQGASDIGWKPQLIDNKRTVNCLAWYILVILALAFLWWWLH